MTATVGQGEPTLAASPSPATHRDTDVLWARLRVLGIVLAVGCGIVLRFTSTGPLWLDESLSVEIARRPLPAMFTALRHDGSPPLYYLLLHGWISLFGSSTGSVRTLSSVLSLAALPLSWYVGRLFGGRRLAVSALLVVATTPWALRYASETRMYSLVLDEVLAGILLVQRARAAPTAARLAALTAITAALAYTHYWGLYLLAPAAGWLLWRRELRVVAAMAASVLLFGPWLPSFVYQLRNTGTPWAVRADFFAFQAALTQWGGPDQIGSLLALLMIPLAALGFAATRRAGAGEPVLLRPGGIPLTRVLGGFALAPLLVVIVLGFATHGGYSLRYTAVCLPFYLLLVARGIDVLPGIRTRAAATALVVVGGLLGGHNTETRSRTQAGAVASVLRASARPGDVIAYCPDQLGPAVHRLLPRSLGLVEIAYADPAGPALVDWVDYRRRVQGLAPESFAADVLSAATPSHDVWLVTQNGYRVYGDTCIRVEAALTAVRGAPVLDVTSRTRVDEPATLAHFTVTG